ncbi:MAG: PaaI family thioesterase [Myxococcota bacterium]
MSEDAASFELPESDRWARHLGIELVEIAPGRVRMRLESSEKHHQPMGILHGGVWASIVETAASYGAGFLARTKGAVGVVGVSNQTDFLRSHSVGLLEIEAEPLHAGRRQHVWEVRIHRPSDDVLVARGQVRFQVLDELPRDRDSANAPKPA